MKQSFITSGPGLDLARGEIQLITAWCFIAQSLSLLSFQLLDMTNNVEKDFNHQTIIIYKVVVKTTHCT